MNAPYQDPPLPGEMPTQDDLQRFQSPQPEFIAEQPTLPPRQPEGLSFDWGMLAYQSREEFDSKPEPLKRLIRDMHPTQGLGIQYSQEQAAKKLLEYQEQLLAASTPAAQLDIAKKQADLAASQKGKPLTSSEVNDLTQLKSVEFSLDELEKKLNAIPAGKRGPVAGRVVGANPYDAEIQEVQNIITSVVPGLARGVFGEVGVLTDTDMERYTKLIPNHSLPPEIANRNLANLRAKLRNSKITKIETMQKAGMDVSGFMEEYKNLMQEPSPQSAPQATPPPAQRIIGGQMFELNPQTGKYVPAR